MPPPTNELNKTENKSNSSSTISLLPSDSDNPLEIDLSKNLSFKEIFNIQSTLSSKYVTGSLTLTSAQTENNSFFPNVISTDQNTISYSSEGKTHSLPIDEKFKDILNNMSNERVEREGLITEPPIKWSSMTQDQVILKLEEKGYQVNSLGNNKYEISRQFQPVKSINKTFNIKMIFNSKNGIAESSTLYQDGKKVSENIIEFENNKKIVNKKFYSTNSTRANKNLIIKKEY